jgi:two-component system nitrate/nitrite sensor histidine kinase NarX
MIGMLNLYLSPEQDLPEEVKSLLQSWLEELALAIEAIRLRNQERATLRHLQLGRPIRSDLDSLLTDVLDSVKDALHVDVTLLDVRSSGTSFPGLHMERGDGSLLANNEFNLILQAVYADPSRAAQFSCAGKLQSILVVPLQLPEGQVVGVLLTGRIEDRDFPVQQRDLLATVARQAALLVESERSRVTLELRSVLQERIRLAREIHDGFAQTLAFLKLNAAQMQTFLARRDIERLDQALRNSYKTLSEAYLDTRQVTDHLQGFSGAGSAGLDGKDLQ